MKKDLYEILGVSRDATQSEIKKTYRQLAKKYHPDVAKHDPEAESKFKEIVVAYEVLSDPQKKDQFDRFGTVGRGVDYRNADVEDLFESFGFGGFGGLGDMFDIFFGQSRTRKRTRVINGDDIASDLRISFEEAIFGCKKEVQVKKRNTCEKCKGYGSENAATNVCPSCGGSGQITSSRRTPFGSFSTATLCVACAGTGEQITNPCKKCGGLGRVEKTDTIELNIPEGVTENTTLRLSGRGEAGAFGGTAGDLYIVIHVSAHEIFRRDGNDIKYELPVSFVKLTLGCEIDVPTLSGKKKVTIESGTQSDSEIRLRNEGVPYFKGKGRGDLIITFKGIVPKKLSENQKDELRKFAGAIGESINEPHKSLLKKIFG